MRKDSSVPKYSPPTPRSWRLGLELTRLREEAGLSLRQVAEKVGRSESWVSLVESGKIKLRRGQVYEILRACDIPTDGEQAEALYKVADSLRVQGWWERMGTLSPKYLTYIAFENEARRLRNFEPLLIPGLLQTDTYARCVVEVGQESDTRRIEERLKSRIARREVLVRDEAPLQFHAVISEAALRCEVGGPEVLKEQLGHLVTMARRKNITIQVLRFAAGAHLAVHGGFAILSYGEGEPDLGHIETSTGSLFLEDGRDVGRLRSIFDDLLVRSMSDLESLKFIREIGDQL